MAKRKSKTRGKWRKFRRFVETKIREAGGLDVSGAEKHAIVAREAAIAWLDEHIEPGDPIAEAATDLAIEGVARLVGMFVQRRYERLKSRGLVQ